MNIGDNICKRVILSQLTVEVQMNQLYPYHHHHLYYLPIPEYKYAHLEISNKGSTGRQTEGHTDKK